MEILGGNTMSKNNKVKAAHMTNRSFEVDDDETAQERRIQKSIAKKASRRFSNLADMIAEDDFYMKNFPIPKGKEMFPAEFRMQYSDLFYPYSPGGPLYVDTPKTTFDIVLCEKKLPVMKAKGLRYTFIKTGEGEMEVRQRLDHVELVEGVHA